MTQDFFQDCIKGIKKHLRILSLVEEERVLKLFQVMFSLYEPSALYWDTQGCDEKLSEAYQPSNILGALELLLQRRPEDIPVYLIWDDASLPIAQANLFDALDHLIDISSASTPFFIVNFQWGFALEWRCALKIFRIADQEKIELVERLNELLSSLGDVMLNSNTNHIRKRIKHRFGFGKELVAWDIIVHQIILYNHKDFIGELRSLTPSYRDTNITLIWTDPILPGIETCLDRLISNWDKIKTVSSSFYLVDDEYNFIIYIYENTIKIGTPPIHSQLNELLNKPNGLL